LNAAVLEAWGIDPDARMTRFGETNVYNVGPYVIKDLGPHIDPSRLAFIESVTRHMNARGIAAQAPVRTIDGRLFVECDGENFILSTFLEGSPVPGVLDGSDEALADIGREIGRMHQVLAAYPSDDLSTQTWHQDLKNDVPSWLEAVRPKLDGEEREIYERFARDVLDTAIAHLTGLPEQLIYRDCHPGNLLRAQDGSLAYIDCDHFCVAPRIFDLAYFTSGVTSSIDDPVRMSRWFDGVRAFLRGYDRSVGLTDGEREAFPYAVMSVFVMFAWWFDLTGEPEWALADVRALAWTIDHLVEVRRAASDPSSTHP